jgi:peptidoglycan/xylan/chitin deacetylase (PgdA/CDA1 family)
VPNLLRNRDGRATFLCYHSVAERGPRFLTVGADLFERQLAQLRDGGYAGGGLAELEQAAAGTLSRPTVFLTFDDGFRDNHDTVLPLIREYGFKAFVFALPPLLDDGAPLDWPEMSADLERFPETMRSVDWAMLEALREGGFEVGSHTLSHPHLPELGPEQLRQELSDSRAALGARLGACDTLAYPFGEWNAEVAVAARECGYRFAFSLPTETGQRRADPFSIPRINVDYRDREKRFAAKLRRSGKEVFLSPALAGLRRRSRGIRSAKY